MISQLKSRVRRQVRRYRERLALKQVVWAVEQKSRPRTRAALQELLLALDARTYVDDQGNTVEERDDGWTYVTGNSPNPAPLPDPPFHPFDGPPEPLRTTGPQYDDNDHLTIVCDCLRCEDIRTTMEDEQ